MDDYDLFVGLLIIKFVFEFFEICRMCVDLDFMC